MRNLLHNIRKVILRGNQFLSVINGSQDSIFSNTMDQTDGTNLTNASPYSITMIWDDILNVPVVDPNSIANWNTFFQLPTRGKLFTKVTVSGNTVILEGGGQMTAVNTFQNNTHLVSFVDTGMYISSSATAFFKDCTSIVTLKMYKLTTGGTGNFCSGATSLVTVDLPRFTVLKGSDFFNCSSLLNLNLPKVTLLTTSDFRGCSSMINFDLPSLTLMDSSDGFRGCTSATTFNFPLLTSISPPSGVRVFQDCTAMTTFYAPNLTVLGLSVANNSCFLNIIGKTITLTVKASLMTANAGSPDGDIVYLQANNTVTVVQT